MNLKFLKYDVTQGEKHIGIITIRLEESIKIILRFKVVQKEGGGYYFQPASHKISSDGKDSYQPAFMFDSTYEYEQVKEFLAYNLQESLKLLNSKQTQQNFQAQNQFQQQNNNFNTAQYGNSNCPF